METRVTVRIEKSEMTKIEQRIKQEYPKIKTVSGVVRLALDEFLGSEKKQAGM
jgi:hypothetical protein